MSKIKKQHMKTLLSVIAATLIVMSILAEMNFNKAIKTAMMTGGTDAEIVSVMEQHGFDMFGDPFTEITGIDKIEAILTK